MNKNKEGKSYPYPNSFIFAIGYIRTYFHLPYRQTEGVIKAAGMSLPNHPFYERTCKRTNKLNIDDSDNKVDESKGSKNKLMAQRRMAAILSLFHSCVKICPLIKKHYYNILAAQKGQKFFYITVINDHYWHKMSKKIF